MSVRWIGLLFVIAINGLLSACSEKTVDNVFGTGSSQKPSACANAAFVKNRFIVNWEDGRVSVESAENVEYFKQTFLKKNLTLIQHAEFDQQIVLHSDLLLNATPQSYVPGSDPNAWGQDLVEAPALWSSGIQGQGVLVGVVDAAVDYSHPQIRPRLAINSSEYNGVAGIDDDGNGFIDDIYGWDFYQNISNPSNLVGYTNAHGTHVSGIILADTNSGAIKGLAPQAKLVPANFMAANGGGSLGDAIQAIKYVSSRGVRVINASWGGATCSQSLEATIASLAKQNVLFVSASGNEGLDLDVSPDFPANYNLPNQLNVAATRTSDMMTTWSNSSFNFVHLGAPGDPIYSSVPGGYAFMSGTSMAAPYVTAAAALLWSAKPQANYAQIRQALLNGVDVRGYRTTTGGRLNVRKALTELNRLVP